MKKLEYVRCVDKRFSAGKPPLLATGAVYVITTKTPGSEKEGPKYEVAVIYGAQSHSTSGFAHRFEPWAPVVGDQVRFGNALDPTQGFSLPSEVLAVDPEMMPGKVGLRVYDQQSGISDWVVVSPDRYGVDVHPVLGRVAQSGNQDRMERTLGAVLHESAAKKEAVEKQAQAERALMASAMTGEDTSDLMGADQLTVNHLWQRFNYLKVAIPKAEAELVKMKLERQKLVNCGVHVPNK